MVKKAVPVRKKMYALSGVQLQMATTNKRNIFQDGRVNNTNIYRRGWDGGGSNVYEIYLWRLGGGKLSKRNIICGTV